MAFKERKKPFRLMVMESLARRMHLSRDDRNKYAYWVKGFEGELKFDEMTQELKCECLILNDLFLLVNGKKVQIDTLIVTAKGIYLYEVKNFEGVYYYEGNKMYSGRSRKEVYDPLNQISHAATLLRQLIEQMGYDLPVKTFVAFMNQNFALYQAPMIEEILLPGILRSHLAQVNEISGQLRQSHRKFAEEIKLMHEEDLSLHNIPYYEESLLKKGVTCCNCGAFIKKYTQSINSVCPFCNKKELVTDTVIRQFEEYRRLFPGLRINATTIFKWSDNQLSAKRIGYTLKQYYKAKGSGRWRYYE
ncbi:NERD domain-containing protein [Desemzia sp. RIT804]|uniref:nuclease-related domain-containing protein n=1 Tax=Desemzia sp. RIT 804 TaxID=2810209 RepID=UPI00194EEA7B|nr:nuclease-related domain-containing protein [Desemzia sp. RIT 804]MBM6615231.1 NERD domain-containing protein [Desemzia sp. RIT 804]